MHTAPQPAKSLLTLPDKFRALGALAAEYALEKLDRLPAFEKSLILAEGMDRLRAALTPDVMARVIALQDTKLGFRTDRPPGSRAFTEHGPYKPEQIRDCFIEAALRGAVPVGNEWNIIAGGCYLTKEFFERKIRTFPLLTDFQLQIGVPATHPTGALVPMSATWQLNGKKMSLACQLHKTENGVELDERVPVRINQGLSVDAIIGKATRKFLYRIYYNLRGVADSSTDDAIVAEDPVAPGLCLPAQVDQIESARQELKLTDVIWAKLLEGRGVKAVAELSRDSAEMLLIELEECLAANNMRQPDYEG